MQGDSLKAAPTVQVPQYSLDDCFINVNLSPLFYWEFIQNRSVCHAKPI